MAGVVREEGSRTRIEAAAADRATQFLMKGLRGLQGSRIPTDRVRYEGNSAT